ncbi:leucine--tRNA ligase [Acidobacteria bacterium Mor1]|nr:leucine--tRNA ligase [Acidobacteria bacterium Mor1]
MSESNHDYDPKAIEPKWQRRWEEAGAFATPEPGERPRFYCLEMLPYPSGRLHMGHVRNYSIGDAVSRFQRMQGADVMHVLGWDAFGLPAENAAMKNNEDPGRWTHSNIRDMRGQAQRLGWGYDWSREFATCDPEYYRWNQWFFLKMLEKGVAYRANRLLNWCPNCATVLANEQVVEGKCWRCDADVVKREIDQWFLRITDYAQELLEEIDRLDQWPDRVRSMQRHWIGRSDGARVWFGVEGDEDPIEVFTTRIDTIYGATYLALSPEHPRVAELVKGLDTEAAVTAFVDEQQAKSVADRFAEADDKLGVFTGRYAIQPFSGEKVPIWVANFVLMDVGTGAIMSVPAHDERDFAFARKYGLPVRPVIRPVDGESLDGETQKEAYPDYGVVENSGPWDGLKSAEARKKMAAEAEEKGFGNATVNYRIKDWGVSRQRYWGTPIPVIHCDDCGPVGVPESDLPVVLPADVDLSGDGGSPLSRVESFVNVDCPRCGKPARRETDTMDTFVDSSWYYFRYVDPKNDGEPFARSAADPWFPVNLYIGGIEHATMHLIYTRFWTKVMRDLGLVEVGEPVDRLFTQGMVIKDGAKMSKSKGNVVDPDAMVERYGADTTRLFSLFAAPPERDLDWSEEGVEGCYRFLSRVWRTFSAGRDKLAAEGSAVPADMSSGGAALRRKTHQTIQRVTDDLGPRMHFNTAVSAIMELINTVAGPAKQDDVDAGTAFALREAFEVLAKLLSPFAPHFAEELWEQLGGQGLVATAAWPEFRPELLVEDEITLVVQVNGKLRGRVTVARDIDKDGALAAAQAESNVAAHLDGKTMRKVIFVPNKLLNLVVG